MILPHSVKKIKGCSSIIIFNFSYSRKQLRGLTLHFGYAILYKGFLSFFLVLFYKITDYPLFEKQEL